MMNIAELLRVPSPHDVVLNLIQAVRLVTVVFMKASAFGSLLSCILSFVGKSLL